MPGANCLDLFAGSGALAWEALSRGAQHVTLIDNNLQAITTLKEHQQILTCQSQSTIIHADARHLLSHPFEKGGISSPPPPFDIIFIDAPFRQNLVKPCLELIEKYELLKKEGWIYVEMEKEESLQLPSSSVILKHKIAGQLQFMLLGSCPA